MRISDWSSAVCSSDLLILFLLVSAAIAAALGLAVDAAVIVGVVIINASVGFIKEGRAEAAMSALRSDRKSGVKRKRVTVRVDLVGRRIITKTNQLYKSYEKSYKTHSDIIPCQH